MGDRENFLRSLGLTEEDIASPDAVLDGKEANPQKKNLAKLKTQEQTDNSRWTSSNMNNNNSNGTKYGRVDENSRSPYTNLNFTAEDRNKGPRTIENEQDRYVAEVARFLSNPDSSSFDPVGNGGREQRPVVNQHNYSNYDSRISSGIATAPAKDRVSYGAANEVRAGPADSPEGSRLDTMNKRGAQKSSSNAVATIHLNNLSVESLKQLGNDAFEGEDFNLAIQCYTVGIDELCRRSQSAVDGAVERSLADSTDNITLSVLFSNRSAAHLQKAIFSIMQSEMTLDPVQPTSGKSATKDGANTTREEEIAELCNQLYDRALFDAESAISLRPDWFKGYARQADVYFIQQRYAPAAEAYEMALRLDPQNDSLLRSLEESRQAARASALEGVRKSSYSTAASRPAVLLPAASNRLGTFPSAGNSGARKTDSQTRQPNSLTNNSSDYYGKGSNVNKNEYSSGGASAKYATFSGEHLFEDLEPNFGLNIGGSLSSPQPSGSSYFQPAGANTQNKHASGVSSHPIGASTSDVVSPEEYRRQQLETFRRRREEQTNKRGSRINVTPSAKTGNADANASRKESIDEIKDDEARSLDRQDNSGLEGTGMSSLADGVSSNRSPQVTSALLSRRGMDGELSSKAAVRTDTFTEGSRAMEGGGRTEAEGSRLQRRLSDIQIPYEYSSQAASNYQKKLLDEYRSRKYNSQK